jgi:putative flippase GtrA
MAVPIGARREEKVTRIMRREAAPSPIQESALREMDGGGFRSGCRSLLLSPTNRLDVQFARYLVVGGLCFVADLGVLVFMTSGLHLYYLLAAAVGFLVGLGMNYLLSTAWVFTERRLTRRWLEFVAFGMIGLLGLGINEILMWLFTEGCGFHYVLSKMTTTGFVLFWNFAARRFLLFD